MSDMTPEKAQALLDEMEAVEIRKMWEVPWDFTMDLARAYIAQATRIADLERQLAEARRVSVAIEEQVATTRTYAADSGMTEQQLSLMETCTSHFLDYARILSALKGTP